MKQKPRWTLEMLTASLAVLCGLLVLVLLIQRPTAWLALLALVPIWLYRGRQGYHSKPFQYACYAFYPMHMLLLVLVLNFVNR